MRATIHKAHQHIHRHLKLQPHRHTGRRLHHKHTSYRALAVILALAGAFMIAITLAERAAADSLFSVSAIVPEPAPNVSATIVSPATDAALTSKSTLVAGSCPISASPLTVVLLLNDVAAGSAACDANNNFALPVVLAPGKYSLVAQTYNTTLGRAPDSTPTYVSYEATRATPATGTLTLDAATPFTIVQADRNVTWQGDIIGGAAPYKVLIDWGDGEYDSHTVAETSQQFTHRYATLASYNARIAVTDAHGTSVQQQYAATAYEALAMPAAVLTRPGIPNGQLIAGLYGLFLTVASVSAIVWLEAKHAVKQETAVTS